MNRGQMVYFRESGSSIVYDGNVDGVDYGHIVNSAGKKFNSQPIGSLLSRGYWIKAG